MVNLRVKDSISNCLGNNRLDVAVVVQIELRSDVCERNTAIREVNLLQAGFDNGLDESLNKGVVLILDELGCELSKNFAKVSQVALENALHNLVIRVEGIPEPRCSKDISARNVAL